MDGERIKMSEMSTSKQSRAVFSNMRTSSAPSPAHPCTTRPYARLPQLPNSQRESILLTPRHLVPIPANNLIFPSFLPFPRRTYRLSVHIPLLHDSLSPPHWRPLFSPTCPPHPSSIHARLGDFPVAAAPLTALPASKPYFIRTRSSLPPPK